MTRVISLSVVTDDDDVAAQAAGFLSRAAILARQDRLPVSFSDADADADDAEPDLDERIQVVHVDPDDVIVATVAEETNMAAAERIRQEIAQAFPGHRIAILPHDVERLKAHHEEPT